MAIIYNSILGKISGKVGNIVFKRFNGKTIITSRPSKSNKKPNESTIKRRLRFALTSKFVRSAIKLNYVKEEWSKTTKKMSAYNAMFKETYDFVSDTDIIDNVTIFPEIGYPMKYDLLKNDNEGFMLRVDFKELLFKNMERVKHIQMGVVIFLKEPLYAGVNELSFIDYDSDLMESKDEIITGMDYYAENSGLTDEKKYLIKYYNKRKVYVTLKFLGEDNELLGHSITIGI